ncbi:MAG: hypothetical protein ACI86H_000353 [bacterium]|jgi:hypothetical protein
MTIRKISLILNILMGTITVIIVILTIMMSNVQKDLDKSLEKRYQSYLLADQLRQSSDDLTRFARTYVVTADDKYEKMYWDILAIRNGKKPVPLSYERIYWDLIINYGEKPRPDGETISLQKMMKNIGFTKEEFAELTKAQNSSNGLVKAETIAMNAVKGLYEDSNGKFTIKKPADFVLARRLTHNIKYHVAKSEIMKPIDVFFKMLDQRTKKEVQYYKDLSQKFFVYFELVVAVLVGLIIINFLVTFKKVVEPVRIIATKIKEIITSKNLASRIQVNSEDEFGEVGKDFNLMLGTFQKLIKEIEIHSVHLAPMSEQLSASIKEMHIAIDEISEKLELDSANINETNGAVQVISSKTEAINRKVLTILEYS